MRSGLVHVYENLKRQFFEQLVMGMCVVEVFATDYLVLDEIF